MPPSGNFGSVELVAEKLNASGTSGRISGCKVASLVVAIVQDRNVAHGLAQFNNNDDNNDNENVNDNWVANGLSAAGFTAGNALGLASQTFVTVSDGTLPSFVTFTWSEQVTIAGTRE
jgi:hypothetical protein